ncbi:hypothetical protein NFI96_002137 [Prochilodus magdalenae]|nr:hypothetical protein NFI96_002137 [Prochilodus magdalenae]
METPLDVLSRAASLVHEDDEKREYRLSYESGNKALILKGSSTRCSEFIVGLVRHGSGVLYSGGDGNRPLCWTLHPVYTPPPNSCTQKEVWECGSVGKEDTVPADGAVGVEVEGHQVFWTRDNKPFILVLTTVPPHTDSLGVSTKTKAGLVTEDDPLPF